MSDDSRAIILKPDFYAGWSDGMTVRAKFTVSEIIKRRNGGGDEDLYSIKLYPVSSGSEENKAFYRYTPGGVIELTTVNQAVVDEFGDHLGRDVYVDFTPADTAHGFLLGTGTTSKPSND